MYSYLTLNVDDAISCVDVAAEGFLLGEKCEVSANLRLVYNHPEMELKKDKTKDGFQQQKRLRTRKDSDKSFTLFTGTVEIHQHLTLNRLMLCQYSFSQNMKDIKPKCLILYNSSKSQMHFMKRLDLFFVLG